MYCGKCGCEIDKDTGLCPRCDFEALKKIRNFKSKGSRKKSARMKFGWLIALILVVAIVASSVVLAVSKGWIGSSDEEESLQIRTTYITYLNNTIVPEIGVYDADRPESSNEGVYSALFSDLDDDDKDEFIVVYSSKNGDNIDFNISCYSYQSNNTVNSSDDESGVEHIGTINALSEADYTEDDNLENHLSHEIIIYSASYNDKNYIILEYLNDTTNSECSFEIHVYTIENGQFAEVSNLFVKTIFTPIFDTAFPRAVYSTKLPESLMIDDSDFDYSLLDYIINNGESWKNLFSVLEEDDSTILYFTTYGCFFNSEYVYDTYYSSDSAAVEGFLSCFGVSLPDSYITIGDDGTEFPYFWLNYPDNVDFIFTYKYYQIREYGDTYYDVTITEKYEINDYTDFGSLINEEEADDESTDTGTEDIYVAYLNQIEEAYEELSKITDELDYMPRFTLYDLDGNGVKELIIKTGTCEADYVCELYTYEDEIIYLGSINGGHSALYLPDEGVGLYSLMAQMGSASLYRVTIENNTVVEEVIYQNKEYDDPDEVEIYEYLETYHVSQTDQLAQLL